MYSYWPPLSLHDALPIYFLGHDRNVGRGAAGTAGRLMQHVARVRQAQAIFRLGSRIDQRTGAGDPAGADDLHFRLHELDPVVDRVAGFDVAALAIDIDRDRRVGIGGRTEERRAGQECVVRWKSRWAAD